MTNGRGSNHCCPAEYGPDTTVYNRYHRRSRKGIRRYPFASPVSTPDEIAIDGTRIEARRRAGGGKGMLTLKPLAAQKAGTTPRFAP